ncbi:MAG: AmmeMemoRadiSam system protein B [Candidatus Aenigmarchaeota archaeon]|nr:AmmeMemoRadiSam system protein B [Candidatus Aenigmarchaeota archaeon]
MREPVAIGFYPGGNETLQRTLQELFNTRVKRVDNVKAVIVPHAGYIYSGSVTAKTMLVAEKAIKSPVVIIGPNHTGLGYPVALSKQTWITPLGEIKTDTETIQKLCENFTIRVDETAHSREHSIEVELPFLQYLAKKRSIDLRIVPVCLQLVTYSTLEKIAETFASVCKKCFFVISSDFTHFGPMYGYEPKKGNPVEQIKFVKKMDKELITYICELKPQKFWDTIQENGCTVCGAVPITLMLLVMKKIRAKKGKLIEYKTSLEVSPSDSFVSYAGIIIQ